MKEISEILGNDYKENLTGFLIRCRTDFSFFCERVLPDLFIAGGLKDYMMEWFNLIESNPRVAILAPSGFAKTTVLGVAYPIWLAFTKGNLQIMVVSKTMPQSRRILALIKSTIENNALLSELRPTDYRETWSANMVKTSTKSSIFCKPYSISIKGERVDLIILDEASSYANIDLYFDYVLPRLNPNTGKVVLISTPESATDLMSVIAERKLSYIFRKYTAIDENGDAIWPERFPLDKLKKLEDELGEQFFQKNFMCNTRAESSNSVFSARSIGQAIDPSSIYTTKMFDKDNEVYMGLDFAIATGSSADFDAYVIVEKVGDRAIVKFAETHRGYSIRAKVERIKELFEMYRPLLIIADESGIGMAIIEELRNRGLPVEAYSFQHKSRNVLLNNLKVILDNNRITVPKNPEDLQAVSFADKLETELLSFKESKSKQTGVATYVSTGSHDDSVMGLALAVSHIKAYAEFEDSWGVA
jgi:hypothetical protein